MKTNLEYFEISKCNPEDLLDSFYAKNLVIIPKTKEIFNELTENNDKLLKLITTFSVLSKNYHKNKQDKTIRKIISDIIYILDNTQYINYSPFTQFFMVYNTTYSIYEKLDLSEKESLIYEMLEKYCQERHDMYLNHGYSNVILQVLCDNYSHKRNSKTSIAKVLEILKPYNLKRLNKKESINEMDDFYFLPDKGDKRIFDYMLSTLKINMRSREIEQNKLPDIVFKHKDNYYICELKTIKESGGGQNKQIVEMAYFINFSEKNNHIHYITFLDCKYSNIIFQDTSPKISSQRKAITLALKKNPRNYFLNTKGMIEFTKDLFSKN